MNRIHLAFASILLVLLLCAALLLGFFWGRSLTITDTRNTLWAEANYIIWTDGTKCYATNGATGNIDFQGLNTSAVINDAIGNLTGGGLVFIRQGQYNISNSLIVHGGIRLQGEGLNKYANQSGTQLQLTANIPLILMNSSSNQYFFSIADMELCGNGYHYGSTTHGEVNTGSSYGISLRGSFSDYLIENLFIHGFYVGIYADSGGWYGRISKCWIESSVYGLFIKHRQVIVSDSSISGNTYAMDLFTGSRDFILESSHVYGNTNGICIEQRTAGTFNYIFGDSQFTDCGTSSFRVYAYTGVSLSFSIDNCELGEVDHTAQKCAIETWTAGTANITCQVENTKFFPVTTTFLLDTPGSTNSMKYVFGPTNVGFVTENSGSTASCVNGTWIAHGLAGQPNGKVSLKVNGTRLVNNTAYVMDPVIIAENSTYVQIEFLCDNAGTINPVGTAEAKTILWYFEYKP